MPYALRLMMLLMLSAAAVAASPATTGPVGVDQTTPRGTLRTFTMAVQAGDGEKIRACLHAPDKVTRQLADALADSAVAAAKLRAAITSKFDAKAAADVLGPSPSAENLREIDRADEKVSGEKASVDLLSAGQGTVVSFVKSNGQWKIVVTEFLPAQDPGTLEMLIPSMRDFSVAFEQVAAEVSAGKLTSTEEVTRQLDAKMKAAASAHEAGATTRMSTTAPAGETGGTTPTTAPASNPAGDSTSPARPG